LEHSRGTRKGKFVTVTGTYRIAIVGASSLAGKELSDAIAESPLAACDLTLLDDEDAAGQITTAGDEASFIQAIDAESFAGVDFVFFAGDDEKTGQYWKTARQAGASIVDMTGALEAELGVIVRAPWVSGAETATALGGLRPDLTTPAVVAAHPAALMLLLVAERLHARHAVRTVAATVFEPASEHGRAAMDELHQQTVSLLSFQTLPRAQFDAQVAFNLLPALGEDAKVKLEAVKQRIAQQYATLSRGSTPELALQLVQAPVFHGYVASVLVELEAPATQEQVKAALRGEHIEVTGMDAEPPSNVSAAGQAEILLEVSTVSAAADGASTRLWLWMAADNLKLAALNAIACASELRRLRPHGKVQ
jgi:aspartate-semialdehyde dehydrogenase